MDVLPYVLPDACWEVFHSSKVVPTHRFAIRFRVSRMSIRARVVPYLRCTELTPRLVAEKLQVTKSLPVHINFVEGLFIQREYPVTVFILVDLEWAFLGFVLLLNTLLGANRRQRLGCWLLVYLQVSSSTKT